MDELGRRLVDRGLLTAEQYERACERARRTRRAPLALLVEDGVAPESALLEAAAGQLRLRFVRLESETASAEAIKALPVKLATHYGVAPLSLRAGLLTIAVSNPYDTSAAEDIQTSLGLRVERVLACRRDVQEMLRRSYGVGAETVERILDGAAPARAAELPEESHDLERMAEDASVIKLVNQIFHDAIEDRATDIHFEIQRDGVRCRRRIDGVLFETNMPRSMRLLYAAIVSRIKLMSGLDIVERRLPQDGRARVKIGAQEFDLRTSVVPSLHGEDVVIRILPSVMLFDLSQLGLAERDVGVLQGLIARPHGILFATGPTGSGKSTTLYACLSRLNTADRKIITIEDPVEYEVRGLTQTQVNPRIGLTFARSLRSMLRHDPDVMMVGEVRDRETAEIAIQTAMTGHLVLSTLHTNDAAGAAVRLTDMGIEPYLIASTVLAFMAQRLVRVICSSCREPFQEEGETFYRGRGCRNCSGTGFRGRVAIC